MDNKESSLKELQEPLIDKSTKDSETVSDPNKLQEKQQEDQLNVWSAMKTITKLSIYPIIAMIFHPAYHLVNTSVLGQHRDSVNLLAIFGLATVTISLTLMSISIAFNSSLSTLIAQAHGQKDARLCGLYLNRQLLLNVVIYIPLCILLMFSEEFFIAIGQTPEMAQKAQDYIFILMPGFICFGFLNNYQRFLAGQREVRFLTVANLIAFLFHIPMCYFFAITLDLDLIGVGISTSIHFTLRFIILLILIRFSRFYNVLVSFSDPDCYKNLMPQFKMSLYSCGMMIWSWWAFDVFTFLGTFMSVSIMAAQTVSRNIALIFYMIPVGLSQATGITVGNMIGAKNIEGAQLYAKMCTLTSFLWGVMSVLVMVVFGPTIIGFFSNSQEIQNLVLEAYAALAFYVLFDCIQCIGTGIISGLGKQGRGSIFTLIGYWAIGIPFSLLQVFYFETGIIALWLGPLLALIFNSISYYTLILCVNWKQIAREAEERRLREKKVLI